MRPAARCVTLVTLALLAPLSTLIPTWYGYHVASPPDRVFLGYPHQPGDHYMYGSFIRQGRDTLNPLMENRLTSEPHHARYVLLTLWFVGLVSRATGAAVPVVWDAVRIVGGVLYILAFWWLLGLYVRDASRRVVATAVFTLGGGIDWIVTLLRLTVFPDIGPAERAYEFFWNWSTFGTLTLGHSMLALVLVVVLWRLLGSSVSVAGALLPVVWFLHPYTGVGGYLTMVLLPVVPVVRAALTPTAVDWSRVRANLRAAAPALASLVVVAAYLLWARADDVFRANSGTTYGWPPNYAVGWYPLTYGLLLPLAWFGLRVTLREGTRATDLVLAWVAAGFLLSVNPIYQGVKFQYQLFPPLALLAARGLFHLVDTSATARAMLASAATRALLVIAIGLNAPLSLVKDLPALKANDELYYSAAELEAMRWLDSQPPGVVLCGYKCGNLAPWIAGKTAFFGHWGLTVDINGKAQQVRWFFSREAPVEVKRQILRTSRARYVFAGPAEVAAGGVDPRLRLPEVYRNGSVTIYAVPAASAAAPAR